MATTYLYAVPFGLTDAEYDLYEAKGIASIDYVQAENDADAEELVLWRQKAEWTGDPVRVKGSGRC
jgi:hypothetical protein